jgi:hypothetical protein
VYFNYYQVANIIIIGVTINATDNALNTQLQVLVYYVISYFGIKPIPKKIPIARPIKCTAVLDGSPFITISNTKSSNKIEDAILGP